MKSLLTLILAGLWVSPSYAALNNLTPEKLALAQQIVTLDNSKKMLQATIQSVIQQTRSSFPPDTPESFFTNLEQNIDQEKLLSDLIQAYGSIYSEQDMKALIGFYQSPGGQQVAAKYPAVAVKLADLSSDSLHEAIHKTLQQLQSSPAP